MPNNKYLSMLGMARRAGKLSMGHDMALKAVREHKAKLLLFAADISPRLIEEFEYTVDKYNPNLVAMHIDADIDQLYASIGYKAGVITVNDTNFSNRIIQLINQEENVYGN